ncbi:MAG: GntR family transcriptional regulator [Paracoccaceae bacterium]
MKSILPSETRLLPQPTLGDQAYVRLSGLLISGRIAPGERLSIRDLATTFEVSMTPVREAVSRLAATGALEVTRNRAATVPLMNVQRFRDITRVRIQIEGFAAAEAARLRDAATLAEIEAAERAFRKLQGARPHEMAKAVQLNQEFHFAVYAAATSPTLFEIIRTLWLQVGPILNLDLRENPERLEQGEAVGCHQTAVAAIKNGDTDCAREAIARDIASAAAFIEGQGKLSE